MWIRDRNQGVAKKIKKLAFHHSIKMFPEAKLFGLTTSLPVMKINSELGYEPVTFSELTDDDGFGKGCQSCVNYKTVSNTNLRANETVLNPVSLLRFEKKNE